MKRILCILLCLSVLGVVPIMSQDAPDREDVENMVSPKVQQMNVREQIMNISTVKIINETTGGHGHEELLAVLAERGITLSEEAEVSLVIGENTSPVVAAALAAAAVEPQTREEGYVLSAKGNAIVLAGADERGTYYAVKTLKQLIQNNAILENTVSDYPVMPIRGVIEGFYGAPWTHEQRKSLFDFFGEQKMNTYIYAPKDDPKHRQQWREPYTGSELTRMQDLIDSAGKNHVKFVYAISPGGDIRLEDGYDQDLDALFDKAQALYELGVRDFAIFLDDIPTKSPQGHAKLVNDFQTGFVKTHSGVSDLITIFTEYSDNYYTQAYTNVLAPLLDKDIKVMWTGPDVVTPSITVNNMKWINEIYGKKMLIWWNYPVNDVLVNNLYVGPATQLGADLNTAVSGLVSNPMNQPEASKLPLFTIADYTWNPGSYDPERSIQNSTRYFDPDLAEEILLFIENVKGSPTNSYTESRTLAPLLQTFRRMILEKEDYRPVAAEIILEADKIEQAMVKIRTQSDNAQFLTDAGRWIDKLLLYAKMLKNFAGAWNAVYEGDKVAFWTDLAEYYSLKSSADASPVIVSSSVMEAFFKDYAGTLIDKETKNMAAPKYKSAATGVTNINAHGSNIIANIADGDLKTFFWTEGPPFLSAPGQTGYAGLDLGRVVRVKNLMVLMGESAADSDIMKNAVIEYSQDGQTYTQLLTGPFAAEFFLNGLDFYARYVRLRNLETVDTRWIKIREFQVNTTETLTGNVPYTDIPAVMRLAVTESVNSAGDRVYALNSASMQAESGRYIGLRFNNPVMVKKVNISLPAPGEGSVQFSGNGSDWESAGNFENSKNAVISVNAAARFVRVILTSPVDGEVSFSVEANAGTFRPVALTNLPTYQSNVIDNMVDDDESTFFWSSAPASAGTGIQISYHEPVAISSVVLKMGVTGHANDYINTGIMQYSADGVTWENIGGVRSEREVIINGINIYAQHLRYVSLADQISWLTVSVFKTDVALTDYGFSGTPKGEMGHEFKKLTDNAFSSVYKAVGQPVSGDQVEILATQEERVKGIEVYQNTLSEAVLKCETENGVKTLGVLSEYYSYFPLNEERLIRVWFEWNPAGALPCIAEITPVLVDRGKLSSVLLGLDKELFANSELETPEIQALQESAWSLLTDKDAGQDEVDSKTAQILEIMRQINPFDVSVTMEEEKIYANVSSEVYRSYVFIASLLSPDGKVVAVKSVPAEEFSGQKKQLFDLSGQNTDEYKVKIFIWKDLKSLLPLVPSFIIANKRVSLKENFNTMPSTDYWNFIMGESMYIDNGELRAADGNFAFFMNTKEKLNTPYSFALDIKATKDPEDPNVWSSAYVHLRLPNADSWAATKEKGLILVVRSNELGLRTSAEWPVFYAATQKMLTLPVDFSEKTRMYIEDRGDVIDIFVDTPAGQKTLVAHVDIDDTMATLRNADRTADFGAISTNLIPKNGHIGFGTHLKGARFDAVTLSYFEEIQ